MADEPVLYINVDVVFVLNLCLDLLWFWVAGRLAGVRTRPWRLIAVAAIGAAAAVWARFPSGAWIGAFWSAKLLGTALLLVAAYYPCNLGSGLKVLLTAILVSTVMAGTVLLADPRGIYPDSPASFLVMAGASLGLAGGHYLFEFARDWHRLKHSLCAVRVTIRGVEVDLAGLVDTGNELKEPLTGRPVMIAEIAPFADLLPSTLRQAVTGLSTDWTLLDHLPEGWAGLFRFVPYRSVGRPAGLLLAFCPERLELRVSGRDEWKQVKGLVALVEEPLHPDGAYRALLPPSLLG